MPFKVTATSAGGVIRQTWPTASEALTQYVEYQDKGYQKIEVRDDAGRLLTFDQLANLALLADKS